MQAAEKPGQLGFKTVQAMDRLADVRASICLECGMPVAAQLLDLARLDLLVLTDRPLRFGTTLQVVIFCNLVNGVSYHKAVVHFCRATHRGWEIGAFLIQPIPEFLSGRVVDDMRGQLRYECDWKAWILWDKSGRLDSVRVISYSIGGMRLMLDRSAESGTEFSLFCSAGNRDQSAIRGKVRWSRSGEDGWLTGCAVAGQRGRDLPRMFGNLTAIHIEQTETSLLLNTGESPEMLLSKMAEPERFLPASH